MHAAGFFSYVHFNDEIDEGHITELRQKLENEVSVQLGEKFELFQDTDGIAWGQHWKKRLHQGLIHSTLFIPVITPAYLKRPACRDELKTFLAKEKASDRDDLVLPLLYIETPALTDETRRKQDPLAEALVNHQYRDWRDLRFEAWNTDKLKRLSGIASEIVKALERGPESAAKAIRSKTAAKKKASRGKGIGNASAKSSANAEMSETLSRLPGAITEPVTLIVDPMPGRGDYTTISAAISAAKGGERILIRPHIYNESLQLDKPLELIGEGRREDIIIEAAGAHVLLFKTTFGRLANVTLRQTGGGNWSCLSLGQGQAVVEDCDITSAGASCVTIHHGANPILRRNRIHDGNQGGVFVFGIGKGTLEDNDIFGNRFSGVEITDGSAPTVRHNRIFDGKAGGVMVSRNGKGVLEDNDIFANELSGVEIKQEGDPILRRNRIHDGKAGGVRVHSRGKGIFEDNDIFANSLYGVGISGEGDPTLRRNQIHHGKQGGVLVSTNGSGTVEDNDIYANAFSGVEIREAGDPALRRNRIHSGKSDGVMVHSNGEGTIEDNVITANGFRGVDVRSGGAPTLRKNMINKNEREAIRVIENGAGTFEENDLRDNKLGAWKLDSSSQDKVVRRDNLET